MTPPLTLTFLGTGTSTGVPALRCSCPTCRSTDARDRRLRASVLIATPWGNLIIDCGPDLRGQLLALGSPPLEAALITHIHYDHVGGIDDLRPYCFDKPDHRFPVHCRADVGAGLRHNFPYSFAENPYPGVPQFNLDIIDPDRPFEVEMSGGHKLEVTPLPVMHAKLPILGYRIGPLAYITDCSAMPDETFAKLQGIDTLVINALRPEKHLSHLSTAEALEIIRRIGPRVAYLTHMSHDTPPHAQASATLPPNVHYAYDGLTIKIPTVPTTQTHNS